jgi:pimeloyl-ACP methyl ester carboxylesterase
MAQYGEAAAAVGGDPAGMTTHLSTPVRLPVIAHGDPRGIPVVLLHGLSDSGRSFEPVLERLPAGIRAYAVTLRGHGDAPRPAGGYDASQLAHDVAAVLDDAGIDRAVVAGHSMGSIVATRLALDAPDRVCALVLMGAKPTFRHLDEFYAEVARFGDAVDPAWVRDFQLSTLAQPIPPAFLDMVVDESLKLPPRVWQALVGPTLGVDHTGDLGRIPVPVLLAWGDRDDIALRHDQETYLRHLPDARLRVYADAGHAFHWEDPAAFARDLAEFAVRHAPGVSRS